MYTEEPADPRYGLNPAFVAKVHAKRRLDVQRQRIRDAMAKVDEERETIDAAARRIMRQRGIGQTARAIIADTAREHNLTILDVLAKTRVQRIVKARREAMYLARAARPENPFSYPQIGKWFGLDHTTVVHGVEMHALKTGLPSLSAAKRESAR